MPEPEQEEPAPEDSTAKRSSDAASEQGNKRARANDEVSVPGTVVSYEWLDSARVSGDGREVHHAVRLQATPRNQAMTVRKGDAVQLWCEGTDGPSIGRADAFVWQKGKEEGPVQVEARWFFRKQDIVAELKGLEEGTLAIDLEQCHKILEQMRPNELILTNLRDQNNIGSIEKVCKVHYLKVDAEVPPNLPENSYVCRYKLEIDPKAKTLKWYGCDSEQEDGGSLTNETIETISSDSSDDDSSSTELESTKATFQEGEGSTLRADISLGSSYQAVVGPFVPGQQAKSRNPTLVWKPNQISDEDLRSFFNKVAEVHTAYLNKLGMTMEEPYSPLPADRAEQVMRETPGNKPLTGSFMSTASMLSSSRNMLLKECDADAILEVLKNHNYDTEATLEDIRRDPQKITMGWTKPERDIFDSGFRRHQGALRMIGKAIAPTKNMKEVVDYHYRFKIPDQFRKYQDKKREQAVRMVECIETRKYHESLNGAQSANGNNENGREARMKDSSHWSEKSVASVATARDERAKAAKTLLLDVKELLGRETMVKVAAVIRALRETYDAETRDELFQLLQNQPELQKRFLEFLPRHF